MDLPSQASITHCCNYRPPNTIYDRVAPLSHAWPDSTFPRPPSTAQSCTASGPLPRVRASVTRQQRRMKRKFDLSARIKAPEIRAAD
ncbi:hypothetical protein QQF64_018579 [Cirrhinus molitorella]|uniref:Uncharacterized protein n=1 Tax=Cirrhinus molitorella TaxID=172907 RepID=A0ABR3LD37_9TELE